MKDEARACYVTGVTCLAFIVPGAHARNLSAHLLFLNLYINCSEPFPFLIFSGLHVLKKLYIYAAPALRSIGEERVRG